MFHIHTLSSYHARLWEKIIEDQSSNIPIVKQPASN